MPKTPELDKLKVLHGTSQVIGQFIDWVLHEKHILFCNSHEHTENCFDQADKRICGRPEGDLAPIHVNIEAILAEYFGIDLKKVDQEREAILEEFRTKSV